MTRDDIPTPALLLDLDRFERNLRRMAAHARASGKNLRPHAKTHRCPEIARRQVSAGALGVACAKLGEAERDAAEYERTQRGDSLVREQSRPMPRRPDLGYDVYSGIQQRSIPRR